MVLLFIPDPIVNQERVARVAREANPKASIGDKANASLINKLNLAVVWVLKQPCERRVLSVAQGVDHQCEILRFLQLF